MLHRWIYRKRGSSSCALTMPTHRMQERKQITPAMDSVANFQLPIFAETVLRSVLLVQGRLRGLSHEVLNCEEK